MKTVLLGIISFFGWINLFFATVQASIFQYQWLFTGREVEVSNHDIFNFLTLVFFGTSLLMCVKHFSKDSTGSTTEALEEN
jgi:hypothetical protein